MIHLRQITVRRGTKVLLENASLDLFAGQKVGIVGPNGVGKSTLFQCLLGSLPCDKGEIDISKQFSIAHLQQELPESELSARDYALLGDENYATRKAQLDAAESSTDGMAIAHAHADFAEIDGYTAPSRAAKVLIGLGFSQEQLDWSVNSFSGGWRMRLNLAQVLLSGADILLLDEPTNHLDLEGIMWLGDWIRVSESMAIVISHDREFLDDISTHIVHVKDASLKRYTGNYTTYEREYNAQLIIQQTTFEKQQAHRAHLQKFVDRFSASAAKAKQAQSRVKMIERMEMVAAVQQENPFRFEFADNRCGVNPMLTLHEVDVGYTEKPILRRLNFSLRDGDRIGLLGLNGAGKSTFIKLIAQELQSMHGEVTSSSKIKIGYFAQQQLDLLDANASMITQLKRIDPKITDMQARTFLGGFNFHGDRVFEDIGNFSGGEKSRLVLALLVWQKPNMLLLDEPTNHLDMEMREALMMALQNFQGAMILVSHDRYLSKCLVNEYMLVDNGTLTPFDGDLDDYHKWLNKRVPDLEIPAAPAHHVEAKPQVNTVRLTSQLEKLEKQLNQLNENLAKIDNELADHGLYQPGQEAQLAKLQTRQSELRDKGKAVESEMLEIIDQLG